MSPQAQLLRGVALSLITSTVVGGVWLALGRDLPPWFVVGGADLAVVAYDRLVVQRDL